MFNYDVSTPSYDRRLWATDWHKLFDSADHRSKLTWLNRFVAASPKIHNFYSSTEDVLGAHQGTPTEAVVSGALDQGFKQYAWAIQEKLKGRRINLGVVHAGSLYGGWAFNLHDPEAHTPPDPTWYNVEINPNETIYREVKTPAEIGTVTSALLDGAKRSPLFKTGWGSFSSLNPAQVVVDTATHSGPSWILGLYGTTSGNVTAGNPVFRAQLLAEAFPALSLPVGGNHTDEFGETRNFNMPVAFASQSAWPRPNTAGVRTWHHNDVREVPYLYLFKLYDEIVKISKP